MTRRRKRQEQPPLPDDCSIEQSQQFLNVGAGAQWMQGLQVAASQRERNGRQTGSDRQIAEIKAEFIKESVRRRDERRGRLPSEWLPEYVYGEDGQLHRADGSTGITD